MEEVKKWLMQRIHCILPGNSVKEKFEKRMVFKQINFFSIYYVGDFP